MTSVGDIFSPVTIIDIGPPSIMDVYLILGTYLILSSLGLSVGSTFTILGLIYRITAVCVYLLPTKLVQDRWILNYHQSEMVGCLKYAR